MKVNPTKTIHELITVLAYVNDVDEQKKIYHTHRVSILSALIAKKRIGREKLKELFYAAVLHDIGGVGFPYHIIHYLKRHDKNSLNILLSHPIIGAQLVSSIPRLTGAAKIILDHHEWVNGSGYPRGKIQKNIPYGSQVIRIADAIDIAIQTRRFSTLNKLKEHIEININKEYPKSLFDTALKILKENRLYYELCNVNKVPAIFKETKNKVGMIRVPQRIDAIGITLAVLAQIIDMKHPYTAGHSQRVSRYTMDIALAMNLNHDDITKFKWAGLIHDIGKLRVPRRILDKNTRLEPDEYARVKKHASVTREILNMVTTLKEIAPIAAAHHERFDGSGYPLGLEGEQIPIGARILSVCDSFDAMTSNRPYRKNLSSEAACEELEKGSGTQFDPKVIKQAIPLFKNLNL